MSTQKITIVARILAKTAKRELVKQELKKLVEISRKEEGCINYDLHQDFENSNLFLFYENWESHDLWKKHLAAPHIQAYENATDGAVQEFIINEMEHIL